MKNRTKPPLPRKQISLRLPAEIHAGMADLAERQHRSIHAQIIWALERHLEADDTAEPVELAA